MPKIRIQFPWPPKQLWPNRNKGKHWGYKQEAVATFRELGFNLAREQSAPLQAGLALKVTYIFCPPNRIRRDLDGMLSAMKAAQDGVAKGLQIDDTQFNPVVLIRSQPVKDGCVIMLIEDAPVAQLDSA